MPDPAPTPPRAPLTASERRTVAAVLRMYREGWFPMRRESGRGVEWVQPEHRAIIPLDDRFHVPRSLAQRLRSGRFVFTTDRAFGEVIRACAQPASGREDTWLDPSIIEAFDLLHKAGHAHSIEAWRVPPGVTTSRPRSATGLHTDHLPAGAVLVGGLYGLALGSVFCGESMFSRPALGGTDASKACLVALVHHLRARGFTLLDAQLANDHLAQFGQFEMPRESYLTHLAAHAENSVTW
ncbi:MAG: leucyl/phenylalanyl-tRNA--protein transferase [Phycisphaerae bacterium]|nr:MAG: leucyl/phenylalanyl-tRNA--protein transferase [Phycisphaerae bacterium]